MNEYEVIETESGFEVCDNEFGVRVSLHAEREMAEQEASILNGVEFSQWGPENRVFSQQRLANARAGKFGDFQLLKCRGSSQEDSERGAG
jgi:hypothetical protein